MFNKLNKRIFKSIFWLAFVFVVAMSLISGYVVVNNFYDTYTRMLESNVKQAALDCDIYFQSVANFTKSTAQRGEIVEALTRGRTENVSRVLNTLCTSSSEIAGAILYGVDGRTFYSTGVGDVPSLNEVLAVAELKDFFASSNASCVSIRNSAMPKIYNTYPYDENNGVVSSICKVYEGERVVGYLFADILPSQLFANKLTLSGYASSTAVIRSGEVVISQSAQQQTQRFSVSTEVNGGDTLTVFVDNGSFIWRCVTVVVVLMLADVICLVAVWVVARRIANKITVPLDNLRAQMQNEDLLL